MPDFSPESIHIDQYDYPLPESRIARFPVTRRTDSRLLLYVNGEISHGNFKDIANYAGNDQLMVFNNTRVIQARINMFKGTGSKIEIFLLEPVDPAEYELAFSSTSGCRWKCMTGNKKRWKGGILEKEITVQHAKAKLSAQVAADHGTWQEIDFSWDPSDLPFSVIIESAGMTPIPPYLNRLPVKIDRDRYQTVYSRHEGSVAAPTAGLHFTKDILHELRKNGNLIEEITLHVGAGTFQPVKSDTIDKHSMHTERFSVSAGTINAVKNHRYGITAVGTTSARTLESLYWLGVKQMHYPQKTTGPLYLGQWEAYHLPGNISLYLAMEALSDYLEKNNLTELTASTQLMIVPGYVFRVTGRLITNFHQPRSTLLLLIASFTGEDWRRIYDYALANDFRFLSYGDSSLLIP